MPEREIYEGGSPVNSSDGIQPLCGSARSQPAGATQVGPLDAATQVAVRVILRRRASPAAVPSLEEYLYTHPLRREALSPDDYAARYGADDGDIASVTAFLGQGGLTVTETHAASRTVRAGGTAAQVEALFAITLSQYRTPAPPSSGNSVQNPDVQAYWSHEGPIHLPAHLTDVVIAVFGLDTRPLGGRNSNGDPPVTDITDVPAVMKRYNFPPNSAAGQTIGILATIGGYAPGDIAKYFTELNVTPGVTGTFTAPTIVPVENIDGTQNDPGDPEFETTQDICIASTVAQGATIAVYFFANHETGWVGALQEATFPTGGNPAPSVLSASYYIADGDDPAGLITNSGSVVPTSVLDAVSLAFQDAVGQGLTVCVASGDSGADSNVGDGGQHVQYPATDPWVLSVGGTTVGFDMSNNPVEYVWNDDHGATGGGVSAYFAQPAWQSAAGVPVSMLTGKSGRGVPDVAANASGNSGYNNIYCTENIPDPDVGRGTSASAPLYAGLFAQINAALGTPVGFVNPVLYALGNTVCADVNGNTIGSPINNTFNNVQGYLAESGWNACTGWGTINGQALLAALRQPQILTKQCTFIVDRSTYGKAEIDAMLQQTPAGAVIDPAFWVVVDGYTPADLGGINTLSGDPQFPNAPTPQQLQSWAPVITAAPPLPASVQFVPVAVGSDDPTLPGSVQRFTFTYQVVFTDDTAFSALVPGQQTSVTLTAQVATSAAETTLLLVDEPDPFMTNGQTSWLSIDLRVFSILEYETRFNADLADGPVQFIQSAIANLTAGQGAIAGGPWTDTFESLATDEEPDVFVYPTTLVGGEPVNVYNFAIARVRYRGLTAPATDVRVFFRTFQAQTTNTTYDQATTYRRALNHEPAPQPVPLLGTNGTEYVTVPYFATERSTIAMPTQDMTYQTDSPNVQTIPADPSGVETDAYFGCWLDLNQTTGVIPGSYQPADLDGPWNPATLVPIQQAVIANPHQCLVAELALDPADPQIPPGAGPSNSDKLAQRNLGWSDLA
jgi:kumamolisin